MFGKELVIFSASALWMSMLLLNALQNLSSSVRNDQLKLDKTWFPTSAEANKIASKTNQLQNFSPKSIPEETATAKPPTKLPPRPSLPSVADDHPICSDNTADEIRAGSEHWHIERADADVSMYPLGGGALGVQITSLSSKSQGVMQAFAGRLALQRQQQKLFHDLKFDTSHFHMMSASHHEHKAPAYDEYLGCDEGQTPSGTAVVVVENFHGGQKNMWHSLANHHGIWLLLQVLEASPSDVTAILPSQYGSPFQYPPRFVSDVLWPMHIHTNEVPSQTNCFEKLIFMETNSAPYWSLRFIKETCSAESPYMKMHQQFHEEAREAALSVLNLDKHLTNTTHTEHRPKVCYMSRRLRPERKRHFSKSFETFIDRKLDDWAAGYGASIDFQKLEFDESFPFAMQVQQSAECSILFGAHGAGLGHMVWMESGAQVIEIGNRMACENYYKSMAQWYGHEYTCFSELQDHNIRHDKNQVYHYLNVTLLLDVLDKAVEPHLP